MKTHLTYLLVLAALLVGASLPATSSARGGTPHFEGKVVRVDRANHRFRIADLQRGSHRVYVTSATRFQRVTFKSLRRGMTVEAKVRRSGARWVATSVARN